MQDFFNRNNDYERNEPEKADDNVGKWEWWRRWHWQKHQHQAYVRKVEQDQLVFDQTIWFASDKNRDFQWTHQELTDEIGVDQANEIYVILGKDITDVISYQEAKEALLGDQMKQKERTFEHAWFGLNYRRDGSSNGQATLDEIVFDDGEIRAVLNV